METTDFDWLNGNWASDLEFLPSNSPRAGTDPDLVLAPSDFWKVDFQARLETLLQDEDKFPGDTYTCEETIIEISIERSRQRGLSKRYKKLGIDWQIIDEHLEGLGDLFSKGRKIIFSIEFVYK